MLLIETVVTYTSLYLGFLEHIADYPAVLYFADMPNRLFPFRKILDFSKQCFWFSA